MQVLSCPCDPIQSHQDSAHPYDAKTRLEELDESILLLVPLYKHCTFLLEIRSVLMAVEANETSFLCTTWSHNKIKLSRWFDVLASSVIECQLIHYTCTLQSFAEATIVVFEVLIGHNSRPDLARELAKILSDSETSNAFFKVCCACKWRNCDVIFGRNPVFHVVKNLVVFIRKAVEQKLNTLKIKFLQKNVSYDCHFAK